MNAGRRGISYLFTAALAIAGILGLALSAEGQPAREKEWERTLEAAKKEGQVTIYASSAYEPVLSEFQQKFPAIKVVSVLASANVLMQRTMGERRAGKYLADLYLDGSTTGYEMYQARVLDPIKPALILPEVLDPSKWWQGKHHYIEGDNAYLFVYNGVSRVEVVYNTRLVNPNEVKSYWDLVNPKWKGKIVFMHWREAGTGTALRFLYYHPELGPDYLRRLFGEMDLTASRDVRQIADWLATGKFAISMLASPDKLEAIEARKQGLPVSWFTRESFKEGAALTTATGVAGLINNAPHPNGTKVFLNWLLSREGQRVYQRFFNKRGDGADSLRTDIPKDEVMPQSRRAEGVKYMITDRAEWMDVRPIVKFIEEAWKTKR
jgi:iron(III) transport system substrate-binding protein